MESLPQVLEDTVPSAHMLFLLIALDLAMQYVIVYFIPFCSLWCFHPKSMRHFPTHLCLFSTENNKLSSLWFKTDTWLLHLQ